MWIKRLRIDNGSKFYGDEFNKFDKDHVIARRCALKSSPQQNGCDTLAWHLCVRKGCHETVDFKPD